MEILRFGFIAILCVFVTTLALKAEQFGGFLENIYDEMQLLNLNKSQEIALKNAIKNHHKFLRQWYIDARKNNKKILEHFTDSTLKNNAHEFAMDKNLANAKIDAEHKFMMSVYGILDAKQRRIFSNKIKAETKDTRKSNKNKSANKDFVQYGR